MVAIQGWRGTAPLQHGYKPLLLLLSRCVLLLLLLRLVLGHGLQRLQLVLVALLVWVGLLAVWAAGG